jgi:hypothetical protein
MKQYRWLSGSIALVVIWSIAALLAGSTPAEAVQYNITQITNNYSNYDHSINNKGQFAWVTSGHNGVNLYSKGNIASIPLESSY